MLRKAWTFEKHEKLTVDFAQHGIHAGDAGDDVGQQAPLDDFDQGLQIYEGRRADVAAPGLR